MIKKLSTGVIALLLTIVAVGLALKRQWHVTRHTVIRAAPEKVFPYFSELHRWQEWSVWTKEMDPFVRHSYEGQPDGVGAKWRWIGPVLGRGQIEIVSAEVPTLLQLDESIESETVNAHARIELRPNHQQTEITWIDEGSLPLPLGGFFRGLVEERLGQHLTQSLAKLKTIVETKEAAAGLDSRPQAP